MKLQVLRTLPECVTVACSGGVDSVSLAHFLKNSGRKVTLAFQNHGNEFAQMEEEFVTHLASEMSYNLLINKPSEATSTSKEANWRNMRYLFLRSLSGTVVTGHNLNDVLETYIMTCARGEGHYMEYAHSNVVRPLLCTPKEDIVKYAMENNLSWLEDPTNSDPEFTKRNFVRAEVVPLFLKMNPGILNTMRRNVIRKLENYEQNS